MKIRELEASSASSSRIFISIFSLGKCKLLSLAVTPLESLGCFSSARLCRSKLSFKLTDLHFHLGHGSLSTLQCGIFSISQAAFKLSKLVSHRVLGSSQRSGMVLLCAKFISKTSSINHCLFGFFLCIFGGKKHTINFSLHCVNGGLQLALASHIASIDCLHIVDCRTGICNVPLQLALSTISSIQKSFALLNFSRKSSSLALRNSN